MCRRKRKSAVSANREKTCIGEEISRVLDFVPGQLEVHNHHLKKYACTCGQCGVTTAPGSAEADRKVHRRALACCPR